MYQVGRFFNPNGGTGFVSKLTPDSGGSVLPDNTGNINILGSAGITTVGTPLANTITLELTGIVATEYDGNSGTAVPSAGLLNIVVSNTTLANFLTGTVNFYATGDTLTLTFTDQFDSTGVGYGALTSQVGDINTGSNTAFGFSALHSLVTGANNTAIGANAGYHWNGVAHSGDNVFIGNNAAYTATTATGNVIIGGPSGENLTTGNFNVIIGPSDSQAVPFPMSSGYNYTSSESSNLILANIGVTGDQNVMRLGTTGTGNGQQSTCYIAGINGVNVGSTAKVVTMGTAGTADQLGTATISGTGGITVTLAQIQLSLMDLAPVE